jgi:hypothetical protein
MGTRLFVPAYINFSDGIGGAADGYTKMVTE